MVRISKSDYPLAALPTLKSNVKLEGEALFLLSGGDTVATFLPE